RAPAPAGPTGGIPGTVSSPSPRRTATPRSRHLLRPLLPRTTNRRLLGAEVARHHARVVADLVGRALGDDGPRLQRVHAVAQAHQERHVVLDDEDGAVELVADLPQQRS